MAQTAYASINMQVTLLPGAVLSRCVCKTNTDMAFTALASHPYIVLTSA